ncbi:MAG: hypothetical protein KBA26_14930, partial [Candidatus Delongbacteria bacterium]|nr:hypothetical protein [Candidatus Delongbacteria bacterium]
MRPDPLTLKAIGGDRLMDSLELSTPYGRRQLEMTDYSILPKEECIRHYQRIDRMPAYFIRHPQCLDRLKNRLGEIESVDSILDHLSRPEIPLSLEEIFILKKHLYVTRRLIEELRDTPFPLSGEADPMPSVWQWLDIDGQETPAFEYSCRHHPDLESARDAYRTLSRRQTELGIQLRRETAERFNLKTVPERLSLSNRDQDALIDQLVRSGSFLICEKNFHNTILQLQPSPTQLELRQQQIEIMDRIQRIEEQIRENLTRAIAPWSNRFTSNTQWIGSLDLDLARIAYAIRFKAVIPEITEHRISLQQGRWVFFQQELEHRQWRYQPLELNCTDRIHVITGMNMGGKSVVLKTIGFLVFHLHLALPVPAVEARLPLFQRIFYSGGETRESSDG